MATTLPRESSLIDLISDIFSVRFLVLKLPTSMQGQLLAVASQNRRFKPTFSNDVILARFFWTTRADCGYKGSTRSLARYHKT